MPRWLFFLNILFSVSVYGQQKITDTIDAADPQQVTVRAYQLNHKIGEVAAPVNYISASDLGRFGNTSIVSAINSTAGVKMEERSPGSYRLNIRGSSLRSPFGVRNVKIYYNDIPLTDPGGNTYLNQLGYYNFQSIEIIKGPASSLYGAGTGGVMLINNDASARPEGVTIDYSTGSYNLQNIHTGVNFTAGKSRNMINYQHQQSNGFRNHSAMRRDVLSWDATSTLATKHQLTTSILFGDLFYETPGALTWQEFQQDNRLARPRAGASASAEEAAASIRQKMVLAGANLQLRASEYWKSNTSFYGAFTQLTNPAIRNYSKSSEPHLGGRTSWSFDKQLTAIRVQWQAGAELQYGFSTANVFDNRNGKADTLRSHDEIKNTTGFLFSQLMISNNNWQVQAGASYNRQDLSIKHHIPQPSSGNLQFNNKLAPRLALLYKVNKSTSLYASVSKGFSPPTVAELFPTGSFANPGLNAEEGWNYDVGVKSKLFSRRLFIDINAFYFAVSNAVVQRRDMAGGDYFINAGGTSQRGIETQLSYRFFENNLVFAPSRIWLNHSLYHFRYNDFTQLAADYSGNKLPGAAPQSVSLGLDVNFKAGLYANITYQFVDAIPLNDANTAYAEAYNLLAIKVGYKTTIQRNRLEIFAAVDNLLNERYSLGNDINGFGGRYYNAAPLRNYAAGISLSIAGRKPGPADQ